ncbi:hypothetical protein [Rhizobium laguerreae]|nr:hypothetical protein [Rhizobium laguerreae]
MLLDNVAAVLSEHAEVLAEDIADRHAMVDNAWQPLAVDTIHHH